MRLPRLCLIICTKLDLPSQVSRARSQVHGQIGSVASKKGALVFQQMSFLEKSVKSEEEYFLFRKKYVRKIVLRCILA
jgi:hypothetical protein